MSYMGGHELSNKKTYVTQVLNDIKEGNSIDTSLGSFEFEYTKELDKIYNDFINGKNILGLMKDANKFKPLFIDKKTNTSLPWSTIDKTPYSVGKSVKPSTKQQEVITLMIFEHLLTSNSIKAFDKFVDEKIEPYWEDIRKNNDWYKSFEVQYNKIYDETKLKNGSFNIFDRDTPNGLMDRFTKIARNMGFSAKDAWNPADIWLAKKGAPTEKLIKKMEDVSKYNGDKSLRFVNRLLRLAYKNKLILGISLKKNNGKQLHYDILNMKFTSKGNQINGKYDSFYISNEFINKKYKLVSSKILFNYNGLSAKLAVRRNQSKLANIVYEFSAGGAAQLGKVPLEQLEKITKRYTNRKIEKWGNYPKTVKDINDNEWLKVFREISSSNLISLTKNISPDQMLADMKSSYINDKLNEDNLPTLMIYKYAYVIADIKDIDSYMTEIYFAAQKKGKIYGGFGKLY